MPLTFGILRILSDPHAVVDDAAEMFDEVPVVVGGDRPDGLVDEDIDARVGSAAGAGRQRDRGAGEREADEIPPIHRVVIIAPTGRPAVSRPRAYDP